jgi:hypothetical protein
MLNWTTADLIGPDGVNQGWPNNVSRAARDAMEQKILDRFGPEELEKTRKACGERGDWNRPPPRGSTTMYGSDYRDPTTSEYQRTMDEIDPEWREAAYPDGDMP